ncbi:unnamed protein product [Callosobruchus maculatus]|uniref:Uncharacterized protein n=1 Tax=Callosobruchus maculatus TaxID=64391 RepID=A0A653CM21_CALMS|nr:unnamed protein product [Callosobruchus maculatus]
MEQSHQPPGTKPKQYLHKNSTTDISLNAQSLRSNGGLIVYGLEEEQGSWHCVTAGTGEHTLTSLSSLDSTEGLLALGDPRSWSSSSLGMYPSPNHLLARHQMRKLGPSCIGRPFEGPGIAGPNIIEGAVSGGLRTFEDDIDMDKF